MIIMGVDPSLRSTGIAIRDGSDVKYHIICSKMTRKMAALDLPFLEIHTYEPSIIEDKECRKMADVNSVIDIFEHILWSNRIDVLYIESIAMSANGRIDQLAFINGCMRRACYARGVPCYAISPSTNKKNFTGNGHATKDDMIKYWKMADDRFDINIKLDDLADAYALACFGKA